MHFLPQASREHLQLFASFKLPIRVYPVRESGETIENRFVVFQFLIKWTPISIRSHQFLVSGLDVCTGKYKVEAACLYQAEASIARPAIQTRVDVFWKRKTRHFVPFLTSLSRTVRMCLRNTIARKLYLEYMFLALQVLPRKCYAHLPGKSTGKYWHVLLGWTNMVDCAFSFRAPPKVI